jgi:phenylalanyl-tRNA synthetase beta chain
MLDRAMKMLEVPRIGSEDINAETGYYIKENSDPAFFPGRSATIYYRAAPEKSGALSTIRRNVEELHIKNDIQIGTLGILHPSVLTKFEIGYPCSALEFTLDPFKKQMQKIWTNDE